MYKYLSGGLYTHIITLIWMSKAKGSTNKLSLLLNIGATAFQTPVTGIHTLFHPTEKYQSSM
jgi:hypothetical protein